MEHPSKKFKHPSEALFVILLITSTKELSKLPIFNSDIRVLYKFKKVLVGIEQNVFRMTPIIHIALLAVNDTC